MYEPRWYRQNMHGERFVSFTVTYFETDLWIGIDPPSFHPDIQVFVIKKVQEIRNILDEHISCHPEFLTSLTPLSLCPYAHAIVRSMIDATIISNTGPMSAVAGAISQFIGEAVINEFKVKEIIVENGGDLYLSIQTDLEAGIYAGISHLSNKLAVVVPACWSPLGLCTSSGTVGHSLSFGKADAAMVACHNAALADAFATRFGNEIKTPLDITAAIKLAEAFPDILSILIIAGDQVGVRGKFQIKPMA